MADTFPFLNELNKVTVVDNGDGTFSLKTTGGGGGGSNVTIVGPASYLANILTTANKTTSMDATLLLIISALTNLLASKNTPLFKSKDVPGATATNVPGFIIGAINQSTGARMVLADFTAGLYDPEKWYMPTAVANATPITHHDIYRKIMNGDFDSARNITLGVALTNYTVFYLTSN